MHENEFDLDHIFTYHSGDEATTAKYVKIREAAKEFARIMLAETPNCADRTVAFRYIREAVMNANAAIATGGRLFK